MTEKQNGAAWQICLARDVTVWSFKQLFLSQLHNNTHTHTHTHKHIYPHIHARTHTHTHTCHHTRLADKHTCVSDRLIISKVKHGESSLCTSPLNYKKLGHIKRPWQIAAFTTNVSMKKIRSHEMRSLKQPIRSKCHIHKCPPPPFPPILLSLFICHLYFSHSCLCAHSVY